MSTNSALPGDFSFLAPIASPSLFYQSSPFLLFIFQVIFLFALSLSPFAKRPTACVQSRISQAELRSRGPNRQRRAIAVIAAIDERGRRGAAALADAAAGLLGLEREREGVVLGFLLREREWVSLQR